MCDVSRITSKPHSVGGLPNSESGLENSASGARHRAGGGKDFCKAPPYLKYYYQDLDILIYLWAILNNNLT